MLDTQAHREKASTKKQGKLQRNDMTLIKCSWSGAPNIVESIVGVGTKIQIKKEAGEDSLHPFHLTAYTRVPALPARFPTSVLHHAKAAKSIHLAMPQVIMSHFT